MLPRPLPPSTRRGCPPLIASEVSQGLVLRGLCRPLEAEEAEEARGGCVTSPRKCCSDTPLLRPLQPTTSARRDSRRRSHGRRQSQRPTMGGPSLAARGAP